MKETSPATSKLRSTLRHGRLTQLCDVAAASSPYRPLETRVTQWILHLLLRSGGVGQVSAGVRKPQTEAGWRQHPSRQPPTVPAHSAEPHYWTIPYWILQQGKGYPGQSLLWGTFTVICKFWSIIWRQRVTLSPSFSHVLCNFRACISCNSCCSPLWQHHPSAVGTVAFLAWRCASVETVPGLSLILTGQSKHRPDHTDPQNLPVSLCSSGLVHSQQL